MNVSKIKISNILGLENLEIEPGSVTEISGANGTGKTSILEAVKAALGGGHDASLLRAGADKGEIVLVLDDGVEINRTVTHDKSNTTVKHPSFGKISKPGEYLKNLTDALSVNPVEFLTAKPKDRVDALLDAIPMKIDAGMIGFVPADILDFSQVNFDNHAMVTMETLRRAMYDARTGVNRSQKDKQATARQLSETVPPAPPAGDWQSTLSAAEAEYKALRNSATAALNNVMNDAQESITSAEADYVHGEKEIAERCAAELERIRTAQSAEIKVLWSKREDAIHAAQSLEAQNRTKLEDDYRPKEAELKERIGHARAMVEQETRTEETLKLARQMENEARKLSEEADKLTDGLTKLEELKSSLLSTLPIVGLEVKDGDIYVDGVAFDRVNEAVRVQLAIEVAKLRAGKLGLIAVDGLERLDIKSYQEFVKTAQDSKLQFIVTKVSNHPLNVESAVA